MFGRSGPLVLTLLASFAALRAEEAVRSDGSRVSGRLTLTEKGRFTFHSGDRDDPVAQVDRIRFTAKAPVSPLSPLWHQVRLANGDLVLGAVQNLDATHLHVRTGWVESLAIPRPAIERVTNSPGMRPIFFDAFDGDLASWTTAGDPRSARGKLVLNRSGQSVEARLKSPLAAGRAVAGFEAARTKSRRAILEAGFERDGKPVSVRVELCGPADRYSVTSAAKPTRDTKLPRPAGPHRVELEFDRDGLNIFIDNLVLWTQHQGPGELRTIRILAEGEGIETAEVDHVLVAISDPVRETKSWGDLTLDAVRSPGGDETFGNLSTLGPRGVTLDVKGKPVTFGWPDVAEFTFRRAAVVEQATAGEHVQVRIRAVESVRDVLTGAVKSFDAKALVLIHPVLGEVTIPRDRLEEIRLLFHGRLIPVDTAPRHLGNRPAFGFAVSKPEGLRFAKSVTIKAAATGGFVLVDAAHLSGKGTPVEMRVNGESIGELNRLADRADWRVRTYRLPIAAVRDGELEVEVHLRPPAEGGRVNGIDLRGLRLELHDPR